MRYDFEWDVRKAKSNFGKHRITFEKATTIFRDPNLLSIPDDEHSETEERWLTMGLDENEKCWLFHIRLKARLSSHTKSELFQREKPRNPN